MSLKRDKICPQCESRKVWWIEESSAITEVAQGRGSYEQFICAQCGFVEWYARVNDLQNNPGYGVQLIDDEPKAGLR
jgi:RNase P subunit RPR2